MQTNTDPITIKQYENSFEGYPGLRDELINGRIKMNPPPKPLHQQIVKNILDALTPILEGTGYTVQTHSGIEFAGQVSELGPDVFIVSVDAWNKAVRDEAYLDTPPLLAVEVVSPSNRNVSDKVQIYLNAGVAAVWVIEPALKKRTVTVYANLEKRTYQATGLLALPDPLRLAVKIPHSVAVKIASFFTGLPEKEEK